MEGELAYVEEARASRAFKQKLTSSSIPMSEHNLKAPPLDGWRRIVKEAVDQTSDRRVHWIFSN